MEEVPDRVADGVDYPESITLKEAVIVPLGERCQTDRAVLVRDVSVRHRMGVAVVEREEFATLSPNFSRFLPLRLRRVVEIPITRLVGTVLENTSSWFNPSAW